MTFIPNLNFYEFIPEAEHSKWQQNKSYKPKTVLLDEVKAGECYEIVITNFHGGAMVRNRIGDMIRITSLKNNSLNINVPQMVFERRADDLIDFATVRLSEKTIWQAVESLGIPYEDWIAFKKSGEMVLNLMIELKGDKPVSAVSLERALYQEILKEEFEAFSSSSQIRQDANSMAKFNIKVTLLPGGTFANYVESRRSEGADVAHLKPQHVNPNQKTLSMITDASRSLTATAIETIPMVTVS